MERVGLELPETSLCKAHEGSAAVTVGDVQFARLRSTGDGREVLQFWVPNGRSWPPTSGRIPGFPRSAGVLEKVVVAELALPELEAVRETLAES